MQESQLQISILTSRLNNSNKDVLILPGVEDRPGTTSTVGYNSRPMTASLTLVIIILYFSNNYRTNQLNWILLKHKYPNCKMI